MADRIILLRAVDANNAPVAGAKATFFEAGTTTPLTVYSDAAGTTPVSQPLLADASGDFAATYATQSVRVVVTTASDVTLGTYPSDPHYITPASASSASGTTFSPVVGNAATNVQAAIANNVTSTTALQALWAAVTGFGRSLIAAADAAAARTTLGLGTAATADTGTAEGDVPILGSGGKLAGTVIPGPDYTSLITGWTANATTTLVHGLGAVPSRVEVVLVAKGTSGGHAIGDEATVAPSGQSASRGMHWTRNSSNIYVMHTSTIFPILRDGSGFMSAATNADWDIRVRAWL